ncbi:MAG: hypothetical protein U0457_03050 [Candidatus Sericytochromatia bacterium]
MNIISKFFFSLAGFFFFIYLIIIFNYKEVKDPSEQDFLNQYFIWEYGTDNEWKMFDDKNKEIIYNIFSRKNEPKIITCEIAIYENNPMKQISKDNITIWNSSPTQENNNTPFYYPPKNLVNFIDLMEKDRYYYIYPPKTKYKNSWVIPKELFYENFITIKKDNFIYIKKINEFTIDTKKSYQIEKEKKEYGIFGNIYDSIKFSRKKKVFRIYIEAFSNTEKNNILKLDSGNKSILLRN